MRTAGESSRQVRRNAFGKIGRRRRQRKRRNSRQAGRETRNRQKIYIRRYMQNAAERRTPNYGAENQQHGGRFGRCYRKRQVPGRERYMQKCRNPGATVSMVTPGRTVVRCIVTKAERVMTIVVEINNGGSV